MLRTLQTGLRAFLVVSLLFCALARSQQPAQPAPPVTIDFRDIATGAGENVYFHRNALADGGFDDLHEGDAVQYTIVIGDNGPGAGRVWRTAESGNPLMAEHNTGALHAKS